LCGSTALLVNCVESYGRSKTVDSYHERRTGSTSHQSSFPKTQSKYGEIIVCLTQDDNTTKLKIGASSFNLLVTSSTRSDKQTITNATVEMGPNTSNLLLILATYNLLVQSGGLNEHEPRDLPPTLLTTNSRND
jgi:hypothetical protein